MKEISSLQHPLVKHLVKVCHNSDYRYDHNSIIIEGVKMLAEAGNAVHFKTVLTTSMDLLPTDLKADEVILTNSEVIKKISGLQSSEGILAEASMPKSSDLKGKKYIIALDQINDPGNLGTILRTALAFGWEGVFLLNEGCDPYNDKALRASRGAIFRIPLARGHWNDLSHIIKENNLKALVADLHGNSFEKISTSNGICLVVGNEAHGPSTEVRAECSAITIPMPGKMESLNVSIAAGILLYHLRKT